MISARAAAAQARQGRRGEEKQAMFHRFFKNYSNQYCHYRRVLHRIAKFLDSEMIHRA